METSNSDANHVGLNAKKTIGEILDPQRLVILVLKSLFLHAKTQVRAGTHRD